MKRTIVLLVVAAMLLMGASAMADTATLSVRGNGVVTLEADTATITLGVRSVSKDVTTAQSAVNAGIASVIEALEGAGIAPADIHTQSISIYPDYNYDDNSNPIAGYTAENMISAKTTDIEKVGAVIDAAFLAGANIFNDIAFSASDASEENDQALRLAIQHAREKAQVMAEAAGMKLGAIQSISEEEYGYYGNDVVYAKAESADAGYGTQVFASPLQVSATVTVVFAIEDAE